MKIKKNLFLVHFLLFSIFLITLINPSFFYWSFLPINAVLFFLSFKIEKLKEEKIFLKYLLLPILFINSAFFYSSLFSDRFLAIIFMLFSVSILFFYYKSCIKYYFIESDKKRNLPLWSNLFGFLTVFLSSALVYALPYFIRFNLTLLFIILIIFLFLPFFQNIHIEQFSKKISLFFSFLFLFCFIPLLWAIFLLPFNYNTLALIVSLFYYLALTFVIFYLKKDLNSKRVKYNLSFLFFMLLFIFLGINWT